MPDNSEQSKKAREYAHLLLKFRPRSINEFREKLSRRGFSNDLIVELTDDFKKRGLLDDAKFAKIWLEDKINLKPMGIFKLKQGLKQKGINEFDIEDAVAGISSEIDEYESARRLAQNRLKQLSGLDKLTIKRRLANFLERRGFSYATALRAVREVTK